jgi:hypothetical protein
MRFADQASRSNKFAIFWAADYIIRLVLDPVVCLRKRAVRVTWPSIGSTLVYTKGHSFAIDLWNTNTPFERRTSIRCILNFP